MTPLEKVDGYDLVGPRTIISANLFVQRWAAKPSTWLRCLRKLDGGGWHVTAYKSKTEALGSDRPPKVEKPEVLPRAETLEKHGAWVLREKLEAPKPATNTRCYFVRIVYRSMGGELLAVEVGPLACLAAEALLGKHRTSDLWVGPGKGTRGHKNCYVGRSKTGAEGAYMIKPGRYGGQTYVGDTEFLNARVVTFPSQMPDPAGVPVEDGGTA